jgi:hypothetical protein
MFEVVTTYNLSVSSAKMPFVERVNVAFFDIKYGERTRLGCRSTRPCVEHPALTGLGSLQAIKVTKGN